MIDLQTTTPKRFTSPPADTSGRIMTGLAQTGGTRCFATIRCPVERTVPWGDVVTSNRTRTVGTIDIRRDQVNIARDPVSRARGDAYPDCSATGDQHWDLSKGPAKIQREREELARKADWRARIRRERIIAEKTRDPSAVHETQSGLAEFEDIDQADVDASATSDADGRLDGLPVFLPESELPDGPVVTDASLTGPDRCDECGASHPWSEPLERGLNGVRDGSAVDGNSDYEHCDPEAFSSHIIDCHCCGCPACGAKSIRFRKTKEPAWACNNPTCKSEFNYPVARPDVLRSDVETDEEKRARLYWECKSCGGATQAPFIGIPADLL
jgi:hypothetical protein